MLERSSPIPGLIDLADLPTRLDSIQIVLNETRPEPYEHLFERQPSPTRGAGHHFNDIARYRNGTTSRDALATTAKSRDGFPVALCLIRGSFDTPITAIPAPANTPSGPTTRQPNRHPSHTQPKTENYQPAKIALFTPKKPSKTLPPASFPTPSPPSSGHFDTTNKLTGYGDS